MWPDFRDLKEDTQDLGSVNTFWTVPTVDILQVDVCHLMQSLSPGML